jgi:Chaperone of endosialidase
VGFDASGIFTRIRGADSWKDDASDGTKIKADLHDINDQDLANGLSDCLTKTGVSLPTTNIPWGGKKITGLARPDDPGDAANKDYVDHMTGWPVSKNIEGANVDGRLNFTNPSGVNGITFTNADLSWVAKKAKASETSNRLVLNDSVIPPTTGNAGDVLFLDDRGMIGNNGQLSHNLSWDSGSSQWRAISPGTGMLVSYGNAAFSLSANDTATVTDPYVATTLRDFYVVNGQGGSVTVTMDMSASARAVQLVSSNAGRNRWLMQLGDAAAETGGNAGSNFGLHAYDDAGGYLGAAMTIARSTTQVSFPAGISGDLTVAGNVIGVSNFISSTGSAVLATTGAGVIYLRPNGAGSATGHTTIESNGDLRCAKDIYAGQSASATYGVYAGAGIREKAASNGAYGDQFINFNWNGSTLTIYANTSTLGQVAWQSDYRTKRDVQPLPSMWEKVKNLKPISYRQKAYQIYVDDDTERWGFLAHELQETLTDYASSGTKDGEDIQHPNHWVVIATLTKALQEAMARIEALEAKP